MPRRSPTNAEAEAARKPTNASAEGASPERKRSEGQADFRWFREQGEALGFGSVFAGPLVRSSYRADEQQRAAASGARAIAYQKQKGTPGGGPSA